MPTPFASLSLAMGSALENQIPALSLRCLSSAWRACAFLRVVSSTSSTFRVSRRDERRHSIY
eukprot:scaffold34560_cov148-Skeletonema_marinoi.AAC.1